ncbi:hypothetical protein I302_103519 [Kwoniella bestiolae CBS 10118]|uniref:J domain-containing protein n=1 Tax=Kwoniella bestiolae CBS 10118 TaxID=1296100 RepID=A0A1B9G8M3_9TREE|nr:hypothetical protein I302_02220 [Kwoniella bestiolae CBS 10118]OCF27378.1 hypothetical protein I302_02220 [Kwoniella bestiolae CBS 10118]
MIPRYTTSPSSIFGYSSRSIRINSILRKHAGPSTLRSFTSTQRRLARTHGNLSHYDVLSLSKNSTKQQIKARFYELSKQYHPDAKGGDTAKFHEINDAYAVLGDDSKRRQYDISLTPASHHSHPSRSHQYGHGHGHSSFSPRDPYLHRAAQGPHRAWSNANSTAWRSGQAPKTESYQPFGRKTPPNFQYTYEYDFNYNPNARTAKSGNRRKGPDGEEGEGEGAGGGGGVWKFLVTVGLIFTVISLGGGLTANSEGAERWDVVVGLEDEWEEVAGLEEREVVEYQARNTE